MTKLFGLGASVIALAAAMPVHAQTAPSTPAASSAGKDTVEVIVTAQKRSERLQDVPKSVDVVQGKKIDELGMRDFQDIQQVTPGVSFTVTESGAPGITMRGVGFDPNSGTQPTVNVYFNETPVDTGTAFRALYDIGQVEVLRGPQGTLRGRTSPSGAVTISTQTPSLHNYEGTFETSISDQGLVNTQIAANFPLIENVLALRIAGLSDDDRGADAYDPHNGTHDQNRTRSGRATLLFKPFSSLKIQATVQQLNENSMANVIMATVPGDTTSPILSATDRIALAYGPYASEYRGTLATLTADWDLGPATLSYIGGYQNIGNDSQHDIAIGGTVPNFDQMQYVHSKSFQSSHELRLASNGNHFWNYLFGVYYDDSNAASNIQQPNFLSFGFNPTVPAVPSPYAVLNIGISTPGQTKDIAFFTDHRFNVTSNDQIEVGVRYQSQKDFRAFNLAISGLALGPTPISQSGIPPEDQHATYDATTGSVSYRHQFSHNLTAYVSWGTSYRPGGAMYTTVLLPPDLLLYKPEHSTDYEAGFKGSAFDNRLAFTFDVYHQDFKNYQAFTGTYPDVSSQANGVVDQQVAFTFNTDAKINGVEGTITARPIDNLTVGLSGTYNEAKFAGASKAPCDDFNGSGVPNETGTPSVPVGMYVAECTLTGSLSSQAPWSLSTNGEYSKTFGNNEYFLRALATVYPKRRDPFSGVNYKGYSTVNLYAGTRFLAEQLELSVWAKNLFNSQTITVQNPEQLDYNTYSTGYAAVELLNKREVGLTLKATF